MNRSNVLEIKKTLKMSEELIPSIDCICTCLVNGNKQKLLSNTERFINLDLEEQFKYIEILKNTLTGIIDKKLLNLEYTVAQADKQKVMAETHAKLFTDNTKRDEFFDQLIANYEFGENYLIVIGHGVYDVPLKASDGAKLEDETETYDFMITAICPVHSTKAGLTYDPKTGRMVSSKQVQIVEAPINGFLYPAFNDRQSDLSGLLYFTKKPEEQHPELIESLLGVPAPTSSVDQQKIFENIIAEVTDDRADFDTIKELHEVLQQKTAEMSDVDNILDKEDLKSILAESGVPNAKLDDFDHIYERAGGTDTTTFKPANLITLDKFNVKNPDIEIKIKPEKTGLIEKKQVDGKNCIVVTLEGDIKLNGIQVSGV